LRCSTPLFDAQAKAIHEHGGEILKFIGDCLMPSLRSSPWMNIGQTSVGRASTQHVQLMTQS
jgi:hypothetical protein